MIACAQPANEKVLRKSKIETIVLFQCIVKVEFVYLLYNYRVTVLVYGRQDVKNQAVKETIRLYHI